jgi:hypothetical protein
LATGWKWLPAIFVKLNDCPALQVPEKRLPRFQRIFGAANRRTLTMLVAGQISRKTYEAQAGIDLLFQRWTLVPS